MICCPCLLFASPMLVSQNGHEEEIDELDAYDPFIDYIDFQDSENEEEDRAFFQTGRILSLGGYVGYRHFLFLPGQERNTTNAPNYGVFIKSFANLNIAIQFSYIGNVSSFYTEKGTARAIYHNLGLEFRYYWNRTRLVRTLARLNPYIFGGAMFNIRTYQGLSSLNKIITAHSNSGGLKTGLGLEYHVSTRFHLGLHAEYNFMFINEAECESTENLKICPPENILNAMFVLGRNF